MSSTKLTIIVQDKDEEGKTIFRRNDTEQIIPKESIRMVKQSPLIMHLGPPFILPPYITRVRGFREKANAVVAGGMMGDENNVYCPLAYCKI